MLPRSRRFPASRPSGRPGGGIRSGTVRRLRLWLVGCCWQLGRRQHPAVAQTSRTAGKANREDKPAGGVGRAAGVGFKHVLFESPSTHMGDIAQIRMPTVASCSASHHHWYIKFWWSDGALHPTGVIGWLFRRINCPARIVAKGFFPADVLQKWSFPPPGTPTESYGILRNSTETTRDPTESYGILRKTKTTNWNKILPKWRHKRGLRNPSESYGILRNSCLTVLKEIENSTQTDHQNYEYCKIDAKLY